MNTASGRGGRTTFSTKFLVSLRVFVPPWLTLVHHGGTKAQRETEGFAYTI